MKKTFKKTSILTLEVIEQLPKYAKILFGASVGLNTDILNSKFGFLVMGGFVV